jgi:hypothetical protein
MSVCAKKIAVPVMVVLISVFLVACATTRFPKIQDKSSTVLVVKKNYVKPADVRSNYFVDYRLVFDNNRYIVVTSSGDYTIIKNLPPGDYRIVKRQSIYKKAWAGRGHDSNLDIRFSLKPGEITILPYQVTFALKKTRTGVSQSFSVQRISDSSYGDIVEELRRYENFNDWKTNETW